MNFGVLGHIGPTPGKVPSMAWTWTSRTGCGSGSVFWAREKVEREESRTVRGKTHPREKDIGSLQCFKSRVTLRCIQFMQKPARRLDHPTGEPHAVSHATDANSSPFSPADDDSSSGSIVDTTRRSAGEATHATRLRPRRDPIQPSQDKSHHNPSVHVPAPAGVRAGPRRSENAGAESMLSLKRLTCV